MQGAGIRTGPMVFDDFRYGRAKLHTVLLSLLCSGSFASPETDVPTQPQLGNNVAGALIFFSYIAAALTFTGFIVGDIVCKTNDGTVDKPNGTTQGSNRRQLSSANKNGRSATTNGGGMLHGLRKLFPALALASFCVLSWNMFNFLIASYAAWTELHDVPIQASVAEIRPYLLHIWQWSTSSNLFQSFAEDLLKDEGTWVYVRLGLLYSYVWNVWMSFIGMLSVQLTWCPPRNND